MRNNETGALQYYYASRNNSHLFDSLFQISTEADLQQVREAFRNSDIFEWVRQQRPNSKWVVDTITDITFFTAKLRDHPIRRGKRLLNYIVENRSIDAVDYSHKTGKAYSDNLCFFRAPAFHNGFHLKNLERDTQHFYKRIEKRNQIKRNLVMSS